MNKYADLVVFALALMFLVLVIMLLDFVTSGFFSVESDYVEISEFDNVATFCFWSRNVSLLINFEEIKHFDNETHFCITYEKKDRLSTYFYNCSLYVNGEIFYKNDSWSIIVVTENIDEYDYFKFIFYNFDAKRNIQ